MSAARTENGAAPIADLIVEAFDAGRKMPPRERLVELDVQLREEIDRLTKLAHETAGKASRRSRQWYDLTHAVEAAQFAIGFEIGSGPLSGALHVAELARRVRDLQRAIGGAES